MKCDLCHQPNTTATPLCISCGEAITRLMTIQAYMTARPVDISANIEQARLLQVFATGAAQ